MMKKDGQFDVPGNTKGENMKKMLLIALLLASAGLWAQNTATAKSYADSGHAAFDRGDYDRAIADYTQGIRLDPNNADIRQNLEDARRKRGW